MAGAGRDPGPVGERRFDRQRRARAREVAARERVVVVAAPAEQPRLVVDRAHVLDAGADARDARLWHRAVGAAVAGIGGVDGGRVDAHAVVAGGVAVAVGAAGQVAGIADGIATFETHPRTREDILRWFGPRFPIVVAEDAAGHVIAFGSTSEYRPRECYAGIAEFSVYVARTERRKGAGRVALESLIDAARRAGFWKLVSRVFVENAASRALVGSLGFREVGIYHRHGQLHGVWRDVVIVERLLTDD